jgi:hypothetical protein
MMYYYLYPHFTDEESEAQRQKVTSQIVVELRATL